jgi:predicted O-methyltransferase YrrM
MPVDARLHDYVLDHQAPENPHLAKLRRRTAELPEAVMQISVEQAHLLALLVSLIGARKVLEIGTFTGYSALAMAMALPDDGRLVACDVSEEWTAIARRAWSEAGVAGRIELRLAPALGTMDALLAAGGRDSFDLVFIDADKTGYPAYYERALPLVRTNGLIVLDNMLRRGRVADPAADDPDTHAIHALNVAIAGDERADRVLLPIGHGMTIARKR